MPTLRRLLVDGAVMVGLGLLLALLGPFGSFAAPFATRLVFWLSLSLGGYALYMPVIRGADALAARVGLPAWAMWVLGWLIASMPMTSLVWAANGRWTRNPAPTLDEAVMLYGDVLLVSGIACLILWFVTAHRRREAAPARADSPPPAPAPSPPIAPASSLAGPRLLDRLPPHLGRDLLALEMEDHYARAHTTAGSALLLMRMRDAVAELEGTEGAQVHRSWWVARAAVTGVARDGRNVRLRLSNGLEAPVARAAVPELRAAGWF